MISYESVSHAYAGIRSVSDVTLSVAPGETVALIGPSGCGKSTLLKLATAVLWPDHGSILLGGKPLTRDTAIELRRRIGYVIQSGGLFPHLSARDNVTLAARHLRREAGWIDSRVAELASMVRLSVEVLRRPPGELSGGQRQRVSLMRALMLDPDVLLLDEPLAALDPMVRHALHEDLKQLFRTLGKSVLLVTHDLAEAAFFAQRIVLMREGRIVQHGTYHDLARSPAEAFVAEFFEAQRALRDVLAGEAGA